MAGSTISIMGQEVDVNEEVLHLDEDRFVIASPQDADLSPLKNMKNLKELHLAGKKITDIEPLAHLENLEILNLNSCREIQNYDFLSRITSLKELYLSKTNIKNLTPIIQYLSNLEVLDVSICWDLKGYHGLYELKKLRVLDINRTNLPAFSSPEKFKVLIELSLFASPQISAEQMLSIRKAIPKITDPVEYISDLIAAKGKKTGETGKIHLCTLPKGDGEVELHWEKYQWKCQEEYLGTFFYNGKSLKAREGLKMEIMTSRGDRVNEFEEEMFLSKTLLCTALVEYFLTDQEQITLEDIKGRVYTYIDSEEPSESISWMDELDFYSEYHEKKFTLEPSTGNPNLTIQHLYGAASSSSNLSYNLNLDDLTVRLMRQQSFDRTD